MPTRTVRLLPLVALALGAAAAHALPTCEQLKALTLKNLTIDSAVTLPEGDAALTATGLQGSVCKVDATLKPTPDSNIKIELFLPDRATWNGKFLGTGNGGLAGHIALPIMLTGVRHRYAAANTDLGTTFPGQTTRADYPFGIGHPEKVLDFASRATHEMTVVSKQILEAFYGKPPEKSYFHGCSTGGRQALTEAWRFPGDYDGIIAGDPVSNFTHLYMLALGIYLQLHKTPDANLNPAAEQLIQDAAVKSCATQHGFTEAYIADPQSCRFDVKTLACTAGQKTGCLTPGEVASADFLFNGLKNPRTGQLIAPGFTPGAKLAREARFSDPVLPNGQAPEQAAQTLNWSTHWHGPAFDFDNDVATVDGDLGFLNISPDLSAFQKRGGKLLLYTGGADNVIPTQFTIDYFNQMTKATPKAADMSRFFIVPGMAHCSGGAGPFRFDTLDTLDAWVHNGKPPAELQGTNPQSNIARPICQFPQIPIYNGTGEPKAASSFTCKAP